MPNRLAVLISTLLFMLVPSVSYAYVDLSSYLPKQGDLVKLPNDHDPATTVDDAVYYIDADLVRRPFPNRRVYESWYEDFSTVKEITAEEMASLRLGRNITYRPGTRLVKIPSVPKVYAVEPGGRLRWIPTEEIAVGLYGPDWSDRVDDVPESFFTDYEETVQLRGAWWPTGTFVERPSDTALFFIDGVRKRYVRLGVREALRLDRRHIVADTGGKLDGMTDGSDIIVAEDRFIDSGQLSIVETAPPTQVDFPPTNDFEAGESSALATVRITAGDAVLIKSVTVTVSGPLWDGDTPQLADLMMVNGGTGENLFGTQQLQDPGADSEIMTFSGAALIPANGTTYVELRATAPVTLPAGTEFIATFDVGALHIAEGGNPTREAEFYWK